MALRNDGITLTFRSNEDTVRRNLHAKKRGLIRALEPVIVEWARRYYQFTYERTPRASGEMARKLKIKYTPRKLNFQVGWWSEDFDRFYPPYVVFGTSRAPAQPSLQVAEQVLRPQFREDFGRKLTEFLAKKGRRRG